MTDEGLRLLRARPWAVAMPVALTLLSILAPFTDEVLGAVSAVPVEPAYGWIAFFASMAHRAVVATVPWTLVLASVVVALLAVVKSVVAEPGPDPVPLGWALVHAVISVGWSIAVLVTSRPSALEPAPQAADLGRQDP